MNKPFRQRLVSLPDDAKRIAIVSDTHGHPHPALRGLLRELEPSLVLHAGDVGPQQILDDLGHVAPVSAVRGNMDGRDAGLPDSLHLTLQHRGAVILEVLIIHIGLWQVRLAAPVRELASALGVGLVICGHSHAPFLGRDRDIVVFNPGSCGPRRYQLPITFGVLELGEQVSLYHVDCETGARWTPPAI